MNFVLDNFLNIKLIKNLLKTRKYLFLLPLIIIFSSLKIYGYVFFFFLCVPYVYQNKNKIISQIKTADHVERLVFFYFLFLIIEIIFGALFLKDERVLIFWLPYMIVLIGAYFKNKYDLKYNLFYRKNYLKIIFISSTIYFVLYFLLNILAYIFGEGFYSIQDNFWIGSSSAFSLSSLLFFSMYNLWEKKQFNIFSYYTLSLIFYILVVLINETRLGLVYTILITFFICLRSLQLKKFLNSALLLIIVLLAYTISSFFINTFHTNIGMKLNSSLPKTDIVDTKTRLKNIDSILTSDDGRKEELFKGLQKFQEYPVINKFFGTGWYSSRITRNLNKNDIRNLKLNHRGKKAHYLQAIVALILDTGFLGILFLGKLYLSNSILIWKRKDLLLNRLFYFILLIMNFLCLFVGYPLVNIPYLLFIFPNGIIKFNNVKS